MSVYVRLRCINKLMRERCRCVVTSVYMKDILMLVAPAEPYICGVGVMLTAVYLIYVVLSGVSEIKTEITLYMRC